MKKTWEEILRECIGNYKVPNYSIPKNINIIAVNREDYMGLPKLFNDNDVSTCHPTIKSWEKVQAALRKGFDQFIGVDYGKDICQKCGCKDEYASPCAKHNNEIRCYKCCE